MEYNAITTRIFDIPPYTFFAIVGIVCAASLFIFLLLKFGYDIPSYTRVFFISGIGLLIGARLFGVLTGLYAALGSGEQITLRIVTHSGIVFYGGMLGFLLSFFLMCKFWVKEAYSGVTDILAICIPVFHFWGRLGCFFGGCCFGIETDSILSIIYTTRIDGEPITAARLPIQLFEAVLNLKLSLVLFVLLIYEKCKGRLIFAYLMSYAFIRIFTEFFRGDMVRGIWNGVSFSQMVSIIILVVCFMLFYFKKEMTYD